jgi:hypothetical protein
MHATRLVPLALVLLIAGCSDGSGSSTPTHSDLSSADLTVAPADLASAPDLPLLDCAQMVSCTRSCTGGPDSGSCVTACIQRGSAAAMTWFQPLEQCAGPACSQTSTDAGPPPCSDPSSQVCIVCVMQFCGNELTACEAH